MLLRMVGKYGPWFPSFSPFSHTVFKNPLSEGYKNIVNYFTVTPRDIPNSLRMAIIAFADSKEFRPATQCMKSEPLYLLCTVLSFIDG